MSGDHNEQLVRYFTQNRPGIGRTMLVKLLYLADIEARKYLGRPLSTFSYRWHHFGPYGAAIIGIANRLHERGEFERTAVSYPGGEWGCEYRANRQLKFALPAAEQAILRSIVKRYAYNSLERIKQAAYATEPMRDAERRKAFGKQLNMSLVDNLERMPGLELESVWQGYEEAERGQLRDFDDVLAESRE